MATEAELDALVEKNARVIGETERLVGEAGEQARAIAAWREENGITGEALAKLDRALTPEMRARLEEERAKTEAEDAHDLEAELSRKAAEIGAAPSRPRPGRNYV